MESLSVAFLVKDPPMERFSALVEFVRCIATEIVVVNTGMPEQDRATIESWSDRFAQGVKVIDHEWKDDFSEARNVGIDACTQDWTLVLDPDEQPTVSMIEHINGVLQGVWNRPSAVGWLYWSVEFHHGVKQEEKNYHWHIRLFKTGHGRFYRHVHQLVSLNDLPEEQTRLTPLCPAAPPLAYFIHSKNKEDIAESDELHERIGWISR